MLVSYGSVSPVEETFMYVVVVQGEQVSKKVSQEERKCGEEAEPEGRESGEQKSREKIVGGGEVEAELTQCLWSF